MTVRIERAAPRDVPLIHNLILKLAEYEKMSDILVSTEQDLSDVLFGPRPLAEALIAWGDDQAVGYALYFETYSTFLGKRGVFLEDLFVEPEHRGAGIGKRLLAAVAQVARERDAWMQWLVLDWNQPSIEFYRRLGAEHMEAWHTYRLDGEALARLAENRRDEPPMNADQRG